MNTELSLHPTRAEQIHARNVIAATLTILPGLGHIYKGQIAAGLLWMLLGMPVVLWMGILLSLATAGAGLLLPLGCWVALAVDAYCERDLRHHHAMPPSDFTDGPVQD